MPLIHSVLGAMTIVALWLQPTEKFDEALARANAVLAKAHLVTRDAEHVAASQPDAHPLPVSRPMPQPAPPSRDETLERIRSMGIFSATFELPVRPTSILSLPGGGLMIDSEMTTRGRPVSYYYYDVEHEYLRVLDGWVKQRVAVLKRDEATLNVKIDEAEREVYRQRNAQVQRIDDRAARRKDYYETLRVQIRVTDDQAAAVRDAAKLNQTWLANVRIDSFELRPAYVDQAPASGPTTASVASSPTTSSATQSQGDAELARREAAVLVNTLPPTIGSLRATLAPR